MYEKIITRDQIFSGKLLTLEMLRVKLPNGSMTQREIIRHPGAVAIIAIDENEEILLVEQFRIAAGPKGSTTLEIPAGTLKEDENPVDCADRELREETGFSAKTIHSLGGFYLAPGYSTEYIHLYSATQLFYDPLPKDEDEFISIVRIGIPEAKQAIIDGRICDAKSIIGIMNAIIYFQ